MKKAYILALFSAALGLHQAQAQSINIEKKGGCNALNVAPDTLVVDYNAGFGTAAVAGSCDYTISKVDENDTWLSFRKESNGNISVFTSYYTDTTTPRYGKLQLESTDGSVTYYLMVKQLPNSSAEDLPTDTYLAIASATASSEQSGFPASNAIDGNESTLWHSAYSGGAYPFTFTLTLKEASHVDYLKYTARTSGGSNGKWGNTTIYYATADAPTTWIEAGTNDFNEASGTYYFGSTGIDNVLKVKIEINSAATDVENLFASAAEVGCYQTNSDLTSIINTYFASPLCNELKSGVTEEQIATIPVPYLRTLAQTLLSGSYSTKFRVGTFQSYLTRSTLREQLKTSSAYDPYENPTGIYFTKGDKVAIFAQGIDAAHPVQLCIKNFSNKDLIGSEGQPESYYTLTNGINLIEPANRGNGYVSYYSDDYANAPDVTLHFAMANEVGYFSQAKNMTNDDWTQILANADKIGADIIDVVSNRLHVAAPLANLKSCCPTDGEKLVTIYDSIIYREREIMGLPQHNIEPRNHQFARPVNSGMFADGTGAAAAFGSFNEWTNPSDFGFWGMGHELGHINQITPGFKWAGCGETTNNIYSAWVEHKLGATYSNGYHRLEDETSGIDDYSWMRGGRFETYLEEGVRKGVSWQLQDGPDYHGTTPNTVTVTGQDENGNSTGSVTTTSRNYDHFVKVVPFWQLELFTMEAGKAPNAWSDFIQSYRDGFDQTTYNTNGKQQIEMMRRFCKAAKLNLCSFFEKAGMLRPIKAYIEDYTKGWNIITQTMCDNLKAEIAELGYPEAPEGLNLINAYNWKSFRDEVKLTEGTVGDGCTLSGDRVKVDNTKWNGAVGYETYNASGELIRISMFGLGDKEVSSNYTYVLFPSSESASYIMAVGYDGTRVKVYQK